MRHAFLLSIATVAVAIFSGGCAGPAGPDQIPIHEALFWTDAQVTTRPSLDPPATNVDVESGTSTVFLTNDGKTHGKMSSRHASSNAVFLTISGTPSEGQTYSFSFADGTMHYDGFAGSGWWYIDPDSPAWAEVVIESICNGFIEADVRMELTVMRGGVPWAERSRRSLRKDETLTFEQRPLPLSPSERLQAN